MRWSRPGSRKFAFLRSTQLRSEECRIELESRPTKHKLGKLSESENRSGIDCLQSQTSLSIQDSYIWSRGAESGGALTDECWQKNYSAADTRNDTICDMIFGDQWFLASSCRGHTVTCQNEKKCLCLPHSEQLPYRLVYKTHSCKRRNPSFEWTNCLFSTYSCTRCTPSSAIKTFFLNPSTWLKILQIFKNHHCPPNILPWSFIYLPV